jgi:hypothetical protein
MNRALEIIRNCTQESRWELVQICEEYDILPDQPIEETFPPVMEMKKRISNRFNIAPALLKDAEPETLELYYEWSRASREEICRTLHSQLPEDEDDYDNTWMTRRY